MFSLFRFWDFFAFPISFAPVCGRLAKYGFVRVHLFSVFQSMFYFRFPASFGAGSSRVISVKVGFYFLKFLLSARCPSKFGSLLDESNGCSL